MKNFHSMPFFCDSPHVPRPFCRFARCTTQVYGVDWEVDEDAYFLYDNWNSSPEQRLDMVLFDGIKGLSRCCSG